MDPCTCYTGGPVGTVSLEKSDVACVVGSAVAGPGNAADVDDDACCCKRSTGKGCNFVNDGNRMCSNGSACLGGLAATVGGLHMKKGMKGALIDSLVDSAGEMRVIQKGGATSVGKTFVG